MKRMRVGEKGVNHEPAPGQAASGVSHSTSDDEKGPFLDIEKGDGVRRKFPLELESTRIGRREHNEIQLLEPHISKKHAEIRREGKRFVIVDLQSRAGILVNGERIQEHILEDGDEVTLGSTSPPLIVFRDPDSPRKTPRRSIPFSSPDAPTPAFPGEDTKPSVDPDATILQTITLAEESPSLEKFSRLLALTRLLNRRFSLTEILESVTDMAIELTSAERGFLILKGPEGKLEYRVARGKEKQSLRDDETRASETIVRKVLETGTTCVVSDTRQEEDLAEAWSVAYFNLRSSVALPLQRRTLSDEDASRIDGAVSRFGTEGEVFGVLYLDSQMTQTNFEQIDRDILESLARDASSTIENARLLRQAVESRKMEEEMERAREIQAALLPESYWKDSHFDVAGACMPSRRLGGDYLDQLRLPDGRCCFVIADVSGKGLPAALLAASLQGALSAEGTRQQPLGELVRRLNQAICRRAPEGKYVTYFCCVLSSEGELTYVNAGHAPPFAITDTRANPEMAGVAKNPPPREPQELMTGDMALGILENNEYQEGSLTLQVGDLVALYTDGVTEAINSEGEFFGESRLHQMLQETRHLPTDEIVKTITDAVKTFSGHLPPRDDVTLLVVKFTGSGTS